MAEKAKAPRARKPAVKNQESAPSELTAFQREMAKPANLATFTAVSMRVEENQPSAFRIARRHTGELVMQGGFKWQDGQLSGVTWRDLPITQLDENGNDVVSHG